MACSCELRDGATIATVRHDGTAPRCLPVRPQRAAVASGSRAAGVPTLPAPCLRLAGLPAALADAASRL
jgi:hypothetical protein